MAIKATGLVRSQQAGRIGQQAVRQQESRHGQADPGRAQVHDRGEIQRDRGDDETNGQAVDEGKQQSCMVLRGVFGRRQDGTLLLGVGTAWLVVMCRFPGKRIFESALLLPLAVPTYVIAYAYTDFLKFAGPVQSWLREVFEWGRDDYWYPNIRSLGGVMALMSLVLYP